ncbi:FtsX-like permease family protein [Oceanobacillus sojae]|uniref:Adhesion component ABC transporter permease n=1 Tax=Oceanobacillus sojae TaxID=582851 RepID=A0A511ZHB7_9BACI|nr:FtsX-like permease family protein [Oceanobacillus sojae]GEN86822.1 adhesion component ABC transporter permease [Oceanobacillus sojae]
MLNIWRISWRNITRKKKRFVLTLLAIIMGTSFITAMLIADRTTKDVFDYYEEMYTGNADFWILSDEHTYPEEIINTVQNHQNVDETFTALDKQTFLDLPGEYSDSQLAVRITGVDNQNSNLLKLPVVEGELDNEGLVIPETVADLLHVDVGDTLSFREMGEVKISAIVEYTQLLSSPGSWERAASSSFRMMAPLDLLQERAELNGEISYIRLSTLGNDEKLFRDIQEELSDSRAFIQPVVADDRQSNDVEGLYTFFYLIAILTMFISGFIVFNMIYTGVIERKKEFAIMKSLGYGQISISRLILMEVSFIAMIGTIIGVPIGIWLGDLFMMTLLGIFEYDMVYSLNWIMPTVISLAAGVIFPVLFSMFPIYSAGKTSILENLKMGANTSSNEKVHWIRYVIGFGLLLFFFIDSPVSYISLILSVVMLSPLFLKIFSMLIKPIILLCMGHPGRMAISNLRKQLYRNANTATLLSVGIAVILLLGALSDAAPENYANQIKSNYGGDVRLTAEKPWSASDLDKINDKEFVESSTLLTEATPITWINKDMHLRQFSIMGVDQNSLYYDDFNYTSFENNDTLSIILGERAFREWGGKIGEDIFVHTPAGTKPFEVIDVAATSHYSGYVAFMDEEQLNHQFGWENSFDLLIHLDENTTEESVRNALWSEFGGFLSKMIFVEEEIASTTSAFEGMNELIQFMLVLVILLASVGTANTLIMNTFERTSEIGTMRALGFTRLQVKTMVLVEGFLIGLAGVLGGLITGLCLLVVASNSTLIGDFVTVYLPVESIILTVTAGILLSLIASWISSSAASKIDIQSSLKEG